MDAPISVVAFLVGFGKRDIPKIFEEKSEVGEIFFNLTRILGSSRCLCDPTPPGVQDASLLVTTRIDTFF